MTRRRKSRRTCPTGKVRYRDHQPATEALHRKRTHSRRQTIPVRTYRCPLCNGHHLTSQHRYIPGTNRKLPRR